MDFSVSSHLRHWLFSSEQLHAHRQSALQECTNRGKGAGNHDSSSPFQELNRSGAGYEGSEEPSTSAPNSEAKRQRGTTPSGSSPPVSIEEQLLLLRFFESKIGAICAELRLPRKVKATALIYFKRVFVHRCCLDNEPSRIMLTCIYLAAKIEESYISAEEFCRAARQDASVVLKGEVSVLQALHFDLVVHSPYRALVGFIKSIEEEKAACSTTSSDISKNDGSGGSATIDDALLVAPPETIQHCRQSALHALDTLMLTDAPLLFTPSQMALAALRSSCNGKGIKLHKFLRHVAREAAARAHSQQQQQQQQQQQFDKEVPEEEVAKAVSQLMGVISQIDQLGMQRAAKQVDQQTEKQQVADVDRRIKLWRSKDPMSNTQSEEYKQTQQAGERDKAAKREAKLRARQESRAQQEAQLLGIPSSAPPPK